MILQTPPDFVVLWSGFLVCELYRPNIVSKNVGQLYTKATLPDPWRPWSRFSGLATLRSRETATVSATAVAYPSSSSSGYLAFLHITPTIR